MAEEKENQEQEQELPKINHGNTRLPFGLCKRYGIALPDDATPRDAWNALAGKGVTPKMVYEKLKKKDREKERPEETKENVQEEQSEKTDYTSTKQTLASKAKFGKNFTKQFFDKSFDEGAEESKKIVDYVSKHGEMSFSEGRKDECSLLFGAISLTGKKSGEGTYYEQNSTFWHETFHAIDGNFIDINNREVKKIKTYGYIMDFGSMNAGASSSVKLNENGDTLKTILKDEIKQLAKAGIVNKIHGEYDNLVLKYAEEQNKNFLQIKKRNEDAEAKSHELSSKRNDALNLMYEKYGYGWRSGGYGAGSVEHEAYEQANREYEAFKTGERSIAALEYMKARIPAEKKATSEFEAVSDMLTSIGYNHINLGHSSSYWRKDSKNQVEEFFADFGAAYSNRKQNYQNLKKYLPKSTEAAEKLLGMMLDGKLKTRKEQVSKP